MASETRAQDIIHELLNTDTKQSKVYEDGLTLTEETIKIKKKGHTTVFSTEFAGTVIEGDLNAHTFTTQTLNKNWYTIRLLNRQRFQKLPHFNSYIHSRIKKAVINNGDDDQTRHTKHERRTPPKTLR